MPTHEVTTPVLRRPPRHHHHAFRKVRYYGQPSYVQKRGSDIGLLVAVKVIGGYFQIMICAGDHEHQSPLSYTQRRADWYFLVSWYRAAYLTAMNLETAFVYVRAAPLFTCSMLPEERIAI